MKVFVVAMNSEAQCVIEHLTDIKEEVLFGRRIVHGLLNGEETLIVVSNIGKGNAAAATQLAIQLTGTKTIYNIGLVGGMDESMQIGDIYEVSDAVQYDFDLTMINGTPCGTLNERETPFIPCHPQGLRPAKRLATGDRFTDSEDDINFLRELNANMRDMEGAAIAHVCEYAGVQLISYKCISDLLWLKNAPDQFSENLEKCIEKLTAFIGKLN